MEPVRIGCLGAARITKSALVKPAAATDGAVVTAIAARDADRARAYAAKHGIATSYGSYAELLADPAVEAVYNPLPNGLHGAWTIRALEAGKHVLCEKPFTANADEAEAVAAAADRTGLVVMEAFHWRYHPLAARMLEIVGNGELGTVRRIEAMVCFPNPKPSDIRWDLGLAGGALMDAGCYAVHLVRTLAGAEPTVVSATAKERSPGVDKTMDAELSFANGRRGHVRTSMLALPRVGATVTGDRATMKVTNPLAPQLWHRLTVKGEAGSRRERVAGGATYGYQLAAFVAAVREGAPTLTPPAESIANMRVIDAIYRGAGMQPRTPTPVGG
jgi:predicted dehydrogenase